VTRKSRRAIERVRMGDIEWGKIGRLYFVFSLLCQPPTVFISHIFFSLFYLSNFSLKPHHRKKEWAKGKYTRPHYPLLIAMFPRPSRSGGVEKRVGVALYLDCLASSTLWTCVFWFWFRFWFESASSSPTLHVFGINLPKCRPCSARWDSCWR